jgi:hypothetical protein
MRKKHIRLYASGVVIGLMLVAVIPAGVCVTSPNHLFPTHLNAEGKNSDVSQTSLLFPPAPSGLYYVFSPFIQKRTTLTVYPLRDWGDKSFPYPTFMFIGSGVGIRPQHYVEFVVCSMEENPPQNVTLYSDGDYYATLTPVSTIIFDLWVYYFNYTSKGFHHLSFVPEGNESAALEIDFLVGVRGFREHILPYL